MTLDRKDSVIVDSLSRNVEATIKRARAHRSQDQFGEQHGMSRQSINNYENGEIPRSWRFLARLRDRENVDLNKMLTEDNTENGGSS